MPSQRISNVQMTASFQEDGSKLELDASQVNTVTDGSVPFIQSLVGVAGNNPVTIPAKAAGLVIVGAAAFFNNIFLKGIGGDTGFGPLGGTSRGVDGLIAYLRFTPGGAASLVLNLQVNETLTLLWS